MKHLILLLVFSGITLIANAQVKWDDNRPLVWSDFKGPVDESKTYSAFTHALCKYSYHWRRTGNTYTVKVKLESYFDEQTSWSRSEKQSDALLKHEQLHFDINELFMRKMMIAFNEKIYTSNYAGELKEIFAQYLKDVQAMQDQYDLETAHSRIRDKQLEWEASIHNQLLETPSYN